MRYKSLREIGPEALLKTEGHVKSLDKIKFGKRVIFDRNITNKDVL